MVEVFWDTNNMRKGEAVFLAKVGRNDPCPCGSGKKYKKCCLNEQNRNFQVIDGGAHTKQPVKESFFPSKADNAQNDSGDKLFEINRRGSELLEQRNLEEAEKFFARELKEYEDTVLRNNLATTYFLKGEFEKSFEALAPLLDPDNREIEGSPYTYALAAQLCATRNLPEEGQAYLDTAVWLFEKTFGDLKREFPSQKLTGWREYTVQLMRAAAYLEDHRQVIDLYYYWEKEHVSWENHHLAAVASFNLGRYQQAISLWKEVGKYWSPANSFTEVTRLVEKDIIPPFSLHYLIPRPEEINQKLEDLSRGKLKLENVLEDTAYCMMLLTFIFDTQDEEGTSSELLEELVKNGGKWGEELGKRLLHAYFLPTPLQMAAVNGLREKGIYQEGEPIKINFDGQEQEVFIKKSKVVEEPDEHTLIALEKSQELKEKGRYEEAIEHLQSIVLEKNFYPPAAINLANLLRLEDRLKEAEKYLSMAEEVLPDEPVVLFNIAALRLEQGRLDEAEEYLLHINREEASEEILEKIELLEGELHYANLRDLFFRKQEIRNYYEEMKRTDLEEKPVTIESKLHTSLKKLPAEWLNVICNILEIEPARQRKEREKQLYEALPDQNNLKLLLDATLDSSSRDLLCYLLEKGGWARLSAVSLKFGTMKGAGFFREEKLPDIPTALLWTVGLVIVGKANLDKRREKVVVIPQELRQPLADLLNINSGKYIATRQTQQLSFQNIDDS